MSASILKCRKLFPRFRFFNSVCQWCTFRHFSMAPSDLDSNHLNSSKVKLWMKILKKSVTQVWHSNDVTFIFVTVTALPTYCQTKPQCCIYYMIYKLLHINSLLYNQYTIGVYIALITTSCVSVYFQNET